MTHPHPEVTVLDRLRALIPEKQREAWYRFAGAVVVLLFGLDVLTDVQAAAWGQLGTSEVTLLFAALYATTRLRLALYLAAGPALGVLQLYGMVNDVRAALIVSAVGQALGITTAAAKTVQRVSAPPIAA